MDQLQRDVEAAFRFRGHVTVHLQGGERLEGYLYNRDLSGKKAPPFVELFQKGSGAPRRLGLSEIQRVELTGEDCAANAPPVPGRS